MHLWMRQASFCVFVVIFCAKRCITAAVVSWHIGDVIRKLREAKGFDSAAKLAAKAGIDRSTVYRIENGGKFDETTIDALAAALGVTARQIRAQVPGNKGKHLDDSGTSAVGSAALRKPNTHDAEEADPLSGEIPDYPRFKKLRGLWEDLDDAGREGVLNFARHHIGGLAHPIGEKKRAGK